MNESTLVPREEMSDLDWLARNVHIWPAGDHQPWCYVYMTYGGVMKAAGIFLDAIANPTMITIDQWLARRAELQNRPSWNDWPQWDFMAQNRNGCWIVSNRELIAGEDGRWHGYGAVTSRGTGEVLGDWRDTLEKRPTNLSEQAVTSRLKEATDNVLAAAPELMTDKYKFEPFTSIKDNQEKDMKQDNGWFERGELPPVGSSVTVVEVDGLGLSDLGREFVGEECKVMATFTRPELSHSNAVDVVVVMEQGGGCCCFVLEMIRPIRTERDELVNVFINHYGNPKGAEGYIGIADAILAAGFSLGAK